MAFVDRQRALEEDNRGEVLRHGQTEHRRVEGARGANTASEDDRVRVVAPHVVAANREIVARNYLASDRSLIAPGRHATVIQLNAGSESAFEPWSRLVPREECEYARLTKMPGSL